MSTFSLSINDVSLMITLKSSLWLQSWYQSPMYFLKEPVMDTDA